MKVRNVVLALAVVSLVAISAFAAKEPGDVAAPVWAEPSVDFVDDSIVFDWEDAEGAEKYSLDICGVVLVNDEAMSIVDAEVEWCVSFSAVDSEITIPLEDLETALMEAIDAAMLDQLGISLEDADDWEFVEIIAKVKGLDPQDKEDSKRQNNLFSEPLDLL